MKNKLIAVTIATAILATGCAGHENAAIGTIGGAGVGAVLGRVIGHSKQSTVIGAAIGAAIGGAIGASMDSAAADAAKNLQLNPTGKNADGTIQLKHNNQQIALKLDDSLMFERGSAVIPVAGQQTLDGFAQSIAGLNSAEYIMFITGHTDSTGGLMVNAPLSKERADAVKNYLEKRLPNVRFDVRGLADAAPLKGHPPSDIENRRTEIQFIKISNSTMMQNTITQRAALESEVNKQLASIKVEQEKLAKAQKSTHKSKSLKAKQTAIQSESDKPLQKSFDQATLKKNNPSMAVNSAAASGFATDWE